MPAKAALSKTPPHDSGTGVTTASRRTAFRRRLPLLPALIFTIALTQLPFVVTIFVSFMNWNANYPDKIGFAGVANYVQVFKDPALRSSVVTSFIITVSAVLGSLILGLGIALLLNQKFRGRAAVRTMMITPFLIVPVAAALLWKHLLYNPTYGLFNGALLWLSQVTGLPEIQPSWITEAPVVSIVVTLIWQWTPFMMLIILAGLQGQAPDVIEAARVDGAGGWKLFLYITLPHARRYLELSTLLGSIYIFQNFDAVFTITAGAFGTSNLPYTIYRTFFQAQNYGLASAMGVVTVAGTMIVVTFFLRTLTTLTEEGSR